MCFVQAEGGRRDAQEARGLGDGDKGQGVSPPPGGPGAERHIANIEQELILTSLGMANDGKANTHADLALSWAFTRQSSRAPPPSDVT